MKRSSTRPVQRGVYDHEGGRGGAVARPVVLC